MGTTSVWHWLIVLVIVLLLFGAKRLPDLASSLGKSIKGFKNAVKEEEGEKPAEPTQVVQNQATPANTTTNQAQAGATTQTTQAPAQPHDAPKA